MPKSSFANGNRHDRFFGKLFMTDMQLLIIALAIILPICAAHFSNARIGDVKGMLRAETQDLRAEMLCRLDRLDASLKKYEIRG